MRFPDLLTGPWPQCGWKHVRGADGDYCPAELLMPEVSLYALFEALNDRRIAMCSSLQNTGACQGGLGKGTENKSVRQLLWRRFQAFDW